MSLSEDKINAIVDRVVHRLASSNATPANDSVPEKKFVAPTPSPSPSFGESLGAFGTIDEAIKAADKAYWEYKSVSIEKRKKIIAAMRATCTEHLEEIARQGVAETGMGRYEDKLLKNKLVIDKTPGVEDLEPRTHTGDYGLTLTECAPFGVIGAVTPSTNPSETIICNSIGMIAGGNSVVFNPHPAAKHLSVYVINLLNKAIISEGGPPNLLTITHSPTIESAQEMMKHPGIRLLVVTGGPGVVRAAMASGKRVIAAGPGNPPAVVDETADLEKAGRDIVMSASCDNNIICIVEKEIIATKKAA